MDASSSTAPDAGAMAGPDTHSLPDRTKQLKPKKEKPPKPKKDASNAKSTTIKSKNKAEAPSKLTPTDPDAMFKVGFLADVYNERPEEKVVTRCMFPQFNNHTQDQGANK